VVNRLALADQGWAHATEQSDYRSGLRFRLGGRLRLKRAVDGPLIGTLAMKKIMIVRDAELSHFSLSGSCHSISLAPYGAPSRISSRYNSIRLATLVWLGTVGLATFIRVLFDFA